MAKIDPIIEQKIKDAASIMDVLTYDLGVELHRRGAEYEGLCPFHADKHLGSFKVSERKNICTCFSCDKTWDPIAALMEGCNMDYPTALRHLAARYNIWIDDQPAPKVTLAKPRETKYVQKPFIYWQPKNLITKALMNDELNPLLRYLYSLPLEKQYMDRLHTAAHDMYFVSTYPQGAEKGWTIWWQIDDQMRVRTGKLMAYKEDGHRDKSLKYSFNFVHSKLAKAGKWDTEKYEYRHCFFGLHLVDVFKDAEICIVESEKSALICQTFCDPNKRLWMATAGKSNLTKEKFEPLIARNRYVVLYPDYDGYDEWAAAAKRIQYDRISISNQVRKYHVPADGDKADIADIMLRLVAAPRETEKDKVARRLWLDACPDNVAYLMDKLNLEVE